MDESRKNRSPKEMLDSGDYEALWNMIYAIEGAVNWILKFYLEKIISQKKN